MGGLLVGLVFAVVVGLVLGILVGTRTGVVFACGALAMGFGIVDGLNLWINAPAIITRTAGPRTVLHDDRSASLLRALVAGPLVFAGDSRRVLGEDHPNTVTSVNNLAGAYQADGDLGGRSRCSHRPSPVAFES